MDLAYPAFLFHFAIFILPFSAFFASGNLPRYLLQTFGVLVPLYVVVFLLILAAQSRHGETWRSIVEEVLHRVPVLGKARRELALSRCPPPVENSLSAAPSSCQVTFLPRLKLVWVNWDKRLAFP